LKEITSFHQNPPDNSALLYLLTRIRPLYKRPIERKFLTDTRQSASMDTPFSPFPASPAARTVRLTAAGPPADDPESRGAFVTAVPDEAFGPHAHRRWDDRNPVPNAPQMGIK
jgi:hypothetical protein